MVAKPKFALFPGTLEVLVLATLRSVPLHGYEIAKRIYLESGNVFRVEEGSLYPALQRLLIEGWVSAEWGVSERNRRVRIYTLTPAGRRQLRRQMKFMGRQVDGLNRILGSLESRNAC
jgi:PadR family transcriptional regulator PadR